ncbi:MAG: S8 family serine peptidase [Alphaproteobacteria bacterium]|nr:S8 family serine peptidase [Alphaproteobacteria bacterium]MBV9899857.1 S8 family serine peptidase [Alphaproteobacteria bacterium]
MPVPPPSPSGTNYNDSEYNRSNGASAHSAITAYNAGATGKGVKIALVDTGVNPNLADFAGKIDPASQDVAANRGVTDNEGHGTATAATAAAARNGSGVMGVAFDATILSFNTANPNKCTDDDGCSHSSTDIARAIDLARVNGARVINISLGGPDSSFAVNSAVARAAAAGIVVVLSAGNSGDEAGGGDPEGFALAAANAGNVIIAGAVDASGNMATFSNRAGSGANTYLSAIGVRVVAPDQTGTLFYWSGTSFSAPVISGAVALLAQAFPNLTGRQIIDILFASATDAGAPGTDAVYGRGILNIARAFQPQGTLSLPGSQVPVDAATGGGQSAGPMGDAKPRLAGVVLLDGFSRAFVVDMASALRRAPRDEPLASGLQQGLHTASVAARNLSVSITVRRNLVGQPEVGLAQLGLSRDDSRRARVLSGLAVSRITPGMAAAFGFSESARTLQQRLSGLSETAFLVARDPMTRMGFYADGVSSFGLRQSIGGFGLVAAGERGQVYQPGLDRAIRQPGYTLGAVSLDRRIGPAAIALGATRLAEERTVLGGRLSESLTAAGATSWFADASLALHLGSGWDGHASYRRGWTSLRGTGGLAQGGRMTSDAWALDVARRNALTRGDSLALRIMQPLRVRAGGLDLSVPVSYDYATLSAGYEGRFFNLAPTGREIDVEAAYGMPLLGGEVSGNVFARRQPGHIAALQSDLGAAIRFTLGF